MPKFIGFFAFLQKTTLILNNLSLILVNVKYTYNIESVDINF